jgi:Fungal N-terminal domain of STAND proteins
MEPISAVSGIAGLIAVAFKTIQLVTEYVNVAHEHKKHAETLHKELSLLKEVLDQLKNFISRERDNGRMMSADDEDRNTVLGRAFADCAKTIEEIQDKLKEPVNRFKKAMAKLKWPFEQKEVLRLVDNLRRYTQLFQLSLTVTNCNLLSQTFDLASEGLRSQCDKFKEIQRLCEGIPHMAKDAEEALAQTETLLKLVPTFLQEVSLDIKEIGLTQRLAEQRQQGEQLRH